MELVQLIDKEKTPGGVGAERRATVNVHCFVPNNADALGVRTRAAGYISPNAMEGLDKVRAVGAKLYLAHFGLREFPFALSPDTSYYYDYFNYREALQTLLTALRAGEGFVKLTAEVGMGKTLLCRRLADQLGDGFVTAYVPSPLLSGYGMLKAVAEELRLTVSRGMGGYDIIKLITSRLIQHRAEGKRVVLLIDEAQVMTRGSLEVLRLFTHFEAEKNKLLQVVLFTQPELDQRLHSKRMRQIQERINVSHQLHPLDKLGVEGYINHRIMVAGFSGKPPFGPEAIHELFRASQGVPRLLNILCHKSLMLAYGLGCRHVSRAMVREAARETLGISLVKNALGRWLGTFFGAMLLFAVLIGGAGIYAAANGRPAAGGTIAGLAIAGLTAVFLTGRVKKTATDA